MPFGPNSTILPLALAAALFAAPMAFAEDAVPPMSMFGSSLSPAVEMSLLPEVEEPSVELELGSLELMTPVDGTELNRGDIQNRKVVLFFWSMYCRSCPSTFKELEAMRQDMEERNIALLPVHLFENRAEKISEALTRFGLSFSTLMAPKAVRDLFSVRLLPTTLVFDQDHRLTARFDGMRDSEGLRLTLFGKVESKK